MTDHAEKLLVTLEEGIKRITINRPERRNSVDRETVQLLLAAIKQSSEDGTRVVILTGAGESFCAGADLAATSTTDIANFDVTKSLRENVNPQLPTGEVELQVDSLDVLSSSRPLPFQLDEEGVDETLRIRYRWLDLRRATVIRPTTAIRIAAPTAISTHPQTGIVNPPLSLVKVSRCAAGVKRTFFFSANVSMDRSAGAEAQVNKSFSARLKFLRLSLRTGYALIQTICASFIQG